MSFSAWCPKPGFPKHIMLKITSICPKKQKKKKEKTKLESKKALQLLKRSLKKWEFMNLSISVIPAVEDADMSTGKLKLLWMRLTNY